MFRTHSLPSLNSLPLSPRKGWSPFHDLCSQSGVEITFESKLVKFPGQFYAVLHVQEILLYSTFAGH